MSSGSEGHFLPEVKVADLEEDVVRSMQELQARSHTDMFQAQSFLWKGRKAKATAHTTVLEILS